MAYVIYYPEKREFVKHTGLWSSTLKGAAKFASIEKVQNFMTKNFPFIYKDIPQETLQYLNTDDLTQSFVSGTTLTDEDAKAVFEWLKTTIPLILAESDKLVSLPRFYGKQLTQLELETQDILHKIEFTNENVINGFHRYKQLQDVRQRRRKVKDNLEYTTLLLTSGLLDSLKKLQAGIDKMTTEMEERTYKPRVLNELFDNENPDD